MKKKTPFQVPMQMDADELLALARTCPEPKDKYACYLRAREIQPDDLNVERAILLHGRWHERDPKNPDFFVIKSYLFHIFEHPEKHTEEEQRRCARELFDHPQLKKCLALAPDQNAFLKAYLIELSENYITLFIQGDTAHKPNILGFSLNRQYMQAMARPVRDVIVNLLSSPFLSLEEQCLAASAFYRAYYAFVHGQSQQLDTLLGAEVCAQLS